MEQIVTVGRYNIIFRDYVDNTKTYDLEKDGACIFKNVISDIEIEQLKEICKENNYKEKCLKE